MLKLEALVLFIIQELDILARRIRRRRAERIIERQNRRAGHAGTHGEWGR